MLIFISIFAALCYAIASWMQWQRATGRQLNVRPTVLLLGIAGFVLHGVSVYHTLHHPNGIDLGLVSIGSLIGWLVTALVIGSSLRQKIDNLFIGVFPMAAITVLLASTLPPSDVLKPYGSGLFLHILLSVLAYSIFTLAALQAILLWRQQLALKHHHTRGLVTSLPPLQIMERLLFEMLWVGFILLSISLITGWLFLDNLFAQHLAHKTVLSIAAWLIYATLLGGRQLLGWRGITAVRWTVGGFLLLMLGYFGSKLVVEFIL